MKKTIYRLGLVILIVGLLAACSSNAQSETIHVKIGVTGSDGQSWDIIKEGAAEEGIEIELVEFSDYTLPNHALANEEVDINSFQHLAFLSQFNVENDYNIVPIGATVIAPLGIYSDNYDSIEDFPDGGEIAVPNDPANLGRSLRLLESAGLIELGADVGLYGTLDDIVSNPKDLDIVLVAPQQTPRVLPDVVASVINSGIAGQAGLYIDDTLFYDDPYSEEARPYVNVFAVNEADKDNEAFLTIARLYQTEEVEEAVREDTNGGSLVVDIDVEDLQETLTQLQNDIKAE
ncbi:D-methionine transport system substrate-binding protein [Amphibacillus marinus]|uniref:Lipoprotein n=1 Tax=Amphibacillus marinus TaxID=872970 RepID=A0A1H8LGE5_9BACI|nr:MetQ/NlpA family ABC transporter substrate-binding protein [Amphibacillus marinus]SEO03818.1 D-methionine transport system substrate-binding protein [Amphibacillus marinus]